MMPSIRSTVFWSLLLLVGISAAVLAQEEAREAFIARFSEAFTGAMNEFDPDRQVRPAAIEILNANDHLSQALRSSLNEEFESVPNSLDEAEEALRSASDILLEISTQGFFASDAVRMQGDLFFLVRDAVPETSGDALKTLGEASLENADLIGNLVGNSEEISILRTVLTDVSSMRLAIASFYGLNEEVR